MYNKSYAILNYH